MSPKQVFADSVASQNELWRITRVLEHECSDEKASAEVDDDSDTKQEERDDPKKGGDDGEKNETKLSEKEHVSTSHDRVWDILESLSSSPSVGTGLVKSGAWIELLGIIVGYSDFTKAWTARVGAAKVISRLLWTPETGSLMSPLLYKFLPHALVSILKDEGAEAMLRVFDKDSERPDLIWCAEMRSELRKGVRVILDDLMKLRDAKATGDGCPSNDVDGEFSLPPTFSVRYPKLRDELYIGGTYVRLFLKEPSFKLRDPSWFLESLLLRWMQELNAFTGDRTNNGGSSSGESIGDKLISSQGDILEQLTSAVVCLCKTQDNLCSKISQWGYIEKAIAFVHRAVALKLVGSPLISAIRLLHVAASDKENIEAMAIVGDAYGKGGLVDGILIAINGDPLHKDTGFMIETLEKIFVGALGDADKAAIVPGNGNGFEQRDTYSASPILEKEASVLEADQTNPSQDYSSAPNDGATSPNETWHPSHHSAALPSEVDTPSVVMGGHSSVQLNYAPGSMAPSPAPGLEPVSKIDAGSDPLSLMSASSAPNETPTTVPVQHQRLLKLR